MNQPVLARYIEHDDRSRNYPAPTADVRTVFWTRHGSVLNQGQLGSCTGNATVDQLNHNPLWSKGKTRHEKQAVQCYTLATKLDNIPGSYPDQDTGSTALAAAKAANQLGWISSYTHAFGFDHCLAALSVQPVMVGTNWYEDMFNPDPDGTVHIGGQVAGGHEYALTGIDLNNRRVQALNSWGRGWANHGNFWIGFDDLERLLSEQGDCTALHL